MDKRKLENPLSRLMGLAGKQKKKYALSIVLAILGVAAGIIPYFAVARMLIALIGGTKEISFFAAYCLMAAAGYLLKVLFSIWSTSVSHTATFEVLKEIRKKLLSKLSRLPMGVILDTPSGRLKDTNIAGWFIGFVETHQGTYFVAVYLHSQNGSDGALAYETASNILKDMNIIE